MSCKTICDRLLFQKTITQVEYDKLMRNLASAQPDQRTGHWKQFALYKNNLDQERACMFCSECETFFDGYPAIKEWKYCPECGARMVGDDM